MITRANLNPANLSRNWTRRRALILAPDPQFGLLISRDVEPNFDLITFSYDSSPLNPELLNGISSLEHFSFQSEFWGESFLNLCKLIVDRYDVVCFMNSDIYAQVNHLNRFFDINDIFRLDFSQPALSRSSFYSHEFTLFNPLQSVVMCPFVEIMMPCLSNAVIREIVKINLTTISGWGIDIHLFPFIQRRLGLRPPAIVHECVVIHCKPVESNRIYSDGLSASQQASKLQLQLNYLDQL
jgi:hypothetical protein